ncbi:MAG: hypothetical protein ACTHLO_14165, partial [Pseudolabrys sp.]
MTGEKLPFAGRGLYAAPAFRSFADAALDAPSARGAAATIARREPGALYKEGAVMARTAALPALKAESGLS